MEEKQEKKRRDKQKEWNDQYLNMYLIMYKYRCDSILERYQFYCVCPEKGMSCSENDNACILSFVSLEVFVLSN